MTISEEMSVIRLTVPSARTAGATADALPDPRSGGAVFAPEGAERSARYMLWSSPVQTV